MTEKRQCFFVDPESYVEGKGYIPSLITEGEPGHAPLTGDPAKHQTPWYWGQTYEEAVNICKAQNEQMGLTPDDVMDIIGSSMRAQRA